MNGMNQDSQGTSVLILVGRCIIDNSDEAWRSFFSAYDGLIRQTFCAKTAPTYLENFRRWFPGWLYKHHKLHYLYRSLREKINAGECSTNEEQQRYVGNYLQKMIHESAIPDFFNEINPVKIESCDFTAKTPQRIGPKSHPRIMELIKENLMENFSQEIRVTFWLKHYAALGVVANEDMKWLSSKVNMSPEKLIEGIDSEAAKQETHEYKISSKFIGELLGISDGTVDQRVHRVTEKLKEMIHEERETQYD